jgi:predicted nuclease with TOPRIM domain
MLQKKFDTVLESMNLEPLDLQPTTKVADLYQELVNELLKMFSLENYSRKLQDELNVIKEAKEEKLAFLEPAKDQINQFV